ncbi:unnamed protein product [Mucor hiemalis]
MSSSDAATSSHEWLPMPSGISLSPHNSFSRELLRQFDKRRSQLHFDSISIQPKDEIMPNDKCSIISSSSNHSQIVASLLLDTTSISSSSISLGNTNDLQLVQEEEEEEGEDKERERSAVLTINDNTTSSTRRSKSAGNLLRKSSVYLKNKFNHHHHLSTIEQQQHTTTTTTTTNNNIPKSSTNTTLFNSIKKKKKSYKPAQDIFQVPNTNQPQEQTQHLSKIAINTTINIGSMNYHPLIDLNSNNTNHIIQPPIITQYPPKPLKYSPVEPLPDEYEYAGNIDNNVINSNSRSRKALHRLSLPLLKLTAASQSQGERREINRRRSDSDLLNEPQQQQQQQLSTTHTSLLHSIGKQWNKLICTCKSKKYSKKEKGRSTD